jgi:hypothetical protein
MGNESSVGRGLVFVTVWIHKVNVIAMLILELAAIVGAPVQVRLTIVPIRI